MSASPFINDYPEIIKYLFSQLPMYQRKGKAAYKADLHNTVELMNILNHPHKNFKSIHIGGTNGKGSTAHLIASVLQEAGYKTGLYTSPHLKDYRERIKINGQMIPETEVIRFVYTYKNEFEKIGLSFFEWTVGLAFKYFEQQQVDIAVIEVGLGGRLDSTNVISPLLSVITNIGLDHTQFLGNSLAEIAKEKAGIIKPHTPVIIGETQPETQPVFISFANEKQAPIVFADKITDIDIPPTGLQGLYQQKNARTAYVALQQLTRHYSFHIKQKHIEQGFKNIVANTGIKGRWQILSQKPFMVTDTAHNKEGLTYTIQQFLNIPHRKAHFILGFVNDKNIARILSLFPAQAHYYFTQPAIPRALKIDDLKQIVAQSHLKGDFFPSPQEAVSYVKSIANQDDIIYVGGSTFIVAEIL